MVDSERMAAEEKVAETQALAVRKAKKTDVWLPNATKMDARPFVSMKTRMSRKANDLFTNEETTKQMIKDPEPGYHYHWARNPQYDSMTGMRVAQGLYQYVTPAEIKKEALAIFNNHKGASGAMIGIGTLVLVKQSPEAWQETHVLPQVEAIAELARIEEGFMGDVEEQSQGRAQGTVEREQEVEEIRVRPDSD